MTIWIIDDNREAVTLAQEPSRDECVKRDARRVADYLGGLEVYLRLEAASMIAASGERGPDILRMLRCAQRIEACQDLRGVLYGLPDEESLAEAPLLPAGTVLDGEIIE